MKPLDIAFLLGFPQISGGTNVILEYELTNWLRPKLKIECAVADKDVQTIVDTILKHARSGSIGDGKVFVMPIEEAYRIRTGESGEETLQAHPDAAATSVA